MTGTLDSLMVEIARERGLLVFSRLAEVPGCGA
jgi:hypothetical protein